MMEDSVRAYCCLVVPVEGRVVVRVVVVFFVVVVVFFVVVDVRLVVVVIFCVVVVTFLVVIFLVVVVVFLGEEVVTVVAWGERSVLVLIVNDEVVEGVSLTLVEEDDAVCF